jgi:hypothetical protein
MVPFGAPADGNRFRLLRQGPDSHSQRESRLDGDFRHFVAIAPATMIIVTPFPFSRCS